MQKTKKPPTKLILLNKFIKRQSRNGAVTFANSLDPVHINKDANISLSEKFKSKVKISNSQFFTRFSENGINSQKSDLWKDPDKMTGSSYKRLKARFDNILHVPVDFKAHKINLPQNQKKKLRNRKRLDHMLKIFCNSGFPDLNKDQVSW